jgi:hypothetical protein
MTDKDSNSDLLNIPMEYATRIYENNANGVTIEQEDPYGQEKPRIVLSKQQAEQVYLALQEFAEGR